MPAFLPKNGCSWKIFSSLSTRQQYLSYGKKKFVKMLSCEFENWLNKNNTLIKHIPSKNHHNQKYSKMEKKFTPWQIWSRLRDLTPCRPKGSPFVLFWDIHFWLTDLKLFLTAPLAPIYTNCKGGARAEKTRFFSSKPTKKGLKTPFSAYFFKFCLRRTIFAKEGFL